MLTTTDNAAPATNDTQMLLGDTEVTETRLQLLHAEARDKLARYGDAGITKPKHVLDFVRDLAYKKVGGQQLTGKCMFCATSLNSTGATRVVDHFIACVLCPTEIQLKCKAMRDDTSSKRKEKEEAAAHVVEERSIVLQEKVSARWRRIVVALATAQVRIIRC